MKVNIETLKDTFKFSYEAFTKSREEGNLIMDYFHNRQFTSEELAILQERGSPCETFNIIKTFARLLLGYYSTVVNAIRVKAVQQDDIGTAAILNDIVSYILRRNNFIAEADKIKLDLMIHGMMCSFVDVEELPTTDDFGRPKYSINISHVPASEIVIDPMSRLEDYSDARFIHRYKWVSRENLVKAFGANKIKDLEPYTNFLEQTDTQFESFYKNKFEGYTDEYEVYLLVHTIMTDDDGKTWEVYWSQDKIIQKKEITFKEVKSPYRLHKLHSCNNVNEYYGIFREVAESQRAINQALVKIQLLVNTNQIYVEDGAVEDIQALRDAINRVNSIIKVNSLDGIRVERLNAQVADQYVIIDKALERIQRILSINDAFLGLAYSHDSGKKMKIQQDASISALRYLTLSIEEFYRLLGKDVINLVKQYYTAEDTFRLADASNVDRWIKINEPLKMTVGVDEMGQQIQQYVWEEYRNPADGKLAMNKDGLIIMVPMPTSETDIQFTEADIEVESIAYNDEAERTRLLLEQFLSGPMGQMLSQVNPAGYFMAGAYALQETRSKYAADLAGIMRSTAQMLQPGSEQHTMLSQGMAAGQEKPKSTSNDITGR